MIEEISKQFIYPEINAILIGAFILITIMVILIIRHIREARDEDG